MSAPLAVKRAIVDQVTPREGEIARRCTHEDPACDVCINEAIEKAAGSAIERYHVQVQAALTNGSIEEAAGALKALGLE